MNIKKDIIKDKDLFDNLYNSSFVKIEVGSKMYGLEHDNSDTDILCVYNTSSRELNQIKRSHHQFQFKYNNIDYLFINIHSFIANSLSGDSTINFEVLNSKKLIGSDLEFLYNYRNFFFNYNIIKSYVGLANRDLKRIDLDAKTDFDKNKKISHAFRGLKTAYKIFENILIKSDDSIFLNDDEIIEIKNNIWSLKNYNERVNYTTLLKLKIDNYRKYINSKYMDKNNAISTYMNIENQSILDSELFSLFQNTHIKKADDFDMTDFYNANENGINYNQDEKI